MGDSGIIAARSQGELRCILASALQALAMPLSEEVNLDHGWIVLGCGATLVNNLQKLLGWLWVHLEGISSPSSELELWAT